MHFLLVHYVITTLGEVGGGAERQPQIKMWINILNLVKNSDYTNPRLRSISSASLNNKHGCSNFIKPEDREINRHRDKDSLADPDLDHFRSDPDISD